MEIQEQLALQERFAHIRGEIEKAQGQSPYGQEVVLMAATKHVSAEQINYAAAHCGLTHIGENRVQELLEKYDALDRSRLQVHFIGSLQTNKVKYIIDKVDMIHSVDSLKLAAEIDRQAAKIGRRMPVLLEINSAMEENKGGISPKEALAFADEICRFPHLSLCGMMTLGKKTENSREKEDFFSKTYQIFIDGKEKKLYNIGRPVLSMGMSDSYREAILCGSTLVRVGTALFGHRRYPNQTEN